ncbi:DNA-binding protein [Proteus sp. G2672]|uniref:DNA-binding protein n=1 Tax=Proteus TaxID=583 RepID=UPI001377A753|nr:MULTISPECIES: DNA-binding protein [Proteus]MCX2587533.1 DNA-binding protein [Proteus penneri]NBL78592.1 DNA-binding protein [Proteus sp. G2672]NBM58145.1 DNA-binding protein [Proteus sp. G2667]NBM79051.1 DNA-binding protein [Proteus sp. G2659]
MVKARKKGIAQSVSRQLQDENGKIYQIGDLIKSGGAGSVSHINNVPSQVSKVYHDKIDKAYYLKKITAMQKLEPALKPVSVNGTPIIQLAWPQARLYNSQKQFVGFVMPELDVKNTIELEYILQERQAKAHGLPTGMGAKVSLAYNLCSLIDALHQQGHRIIDMKPLNLRFYKSSLYMSLLDCDGFSIQGENTRYPAGQFTVEYLAPEFQAKQTIPEAEEEWQDRFALAVIIFQLLNFGIHPFSGRPKNDTVPTDIPRRIAGRFYGYGIKAHNLISPSVASGHKQLPDTLRTLFDKAFSGAPSLRPSAKTWATALYEYAQPEKQQMLVCQKDKNHQHFAGKACAACARQAQLQQVATTQKQNQTQQEQVRQTRVQNTIARQATIRTAPSKPMQPPAIFIAIKQAISKVPKVILHTAIAMTVPVVLGLLLMNFIPQGASGSLGSSWVADLIKADYIEQILITMLSVMFLMVSAIILLVIFVFPSMHILKRKP